MQPRVDLISLGVRSVDASRSFYVDGLGWPVHREVRGEVLFIQANHGLILSLWDAGQMQAEAATDPPSSRPCITLSHNVGSAEEVDQAMRQAEAAGFAYGWLFDSHVLWRDPYPLLTLMAQSTERMRLGTCVTNPGTREPSVTASVLATLTLGAAPVEGAAIVSGDTVPVHPASCAIGKVCPAIPMDPLRAGPVFAATEYCTEPPPRTISMLEKTSRVSSSSGNSRSIGRMTPTPSDTPTTESARF